MATIAGGVSMKEEILSDRKTSSQKQAVSVISGMRSMRVLPWSYCFWYM